MARGYTARARRLALQQKQPPAVFVQGGQSPASNDDIDPEQRLFSFYAPSLTAGLHHVVVEQKVTSPDNVSLDPIKQEKSFIVAAPRFSLPAADIHSIHPAGGALISNKTLPHIVFTDPHLPWERVASTKPLSDPEKLQARVPWLALWVFSSDELLTPAWPPTMPGTVPSASLTMAFTLSFKQLFNLQDNQKSIVCPYNDTSVDPISPEEKADFIFIPGDLFSSYVSAYEVTGKPSPNPTVDLSSYKYLSHVRSLNAEAMDFGDMSNGLYSVSLANRVGPLDKAQYAKGNVYAYAHLVSLEGIESNIQLPITSPVAACSLHSWAFQYTLEDQDVEFVTHLKNIPTGQNEIPFLRAPESTYKHLASSKDPVEQRVGRLIQDGYTLSRYIVQTGEETVSKLRSAFMPTRSYELSTSAHLIAAEHQGSFSSDFQILDKVTGIMDNTYSAAWTLGRTKAFSDQAFATALVRLRQQMHTEAMSKSKAEVALVHLTGPTIIPRLKDHVTTLGKINLTGVMGTPRWKSQEQEMLQPKPDLTFWGEETRKKFLGHIRDVSLKYASAGGEKFYTGINKPTSTDWATLQKWVMDSLHFRNIPSQYLIADTGHLPPTDALRFFTIDSIWTSAFLDGALSLGNHVEGDADSIRKAIKEALNAFLCNTDEKTGYKQQIPTTGFLFRSPLVRRYPDICVQAERADLNDTRLPILRRELIGPDTLLVLFDRPLTKEDFPKGVVISQPPHQQSFAACDTLTMNDGDPTATKMAVSYKSIPIDNKTKVPISNLTPSKEWDLTLPFCPVLDKATRVLLMKNYVQEALDFLKTRVPSFPPEKIPTASLLGLQLNESLAQVTISFSSGGVEKTGPRGPQLGMLEPRNRDSLAEGYRKRRDATAGYVERLPTLPVPGFIASAADQIALSVAPPHYAPLRGPRTGSSLSRQLLSELLQGSDSKALLREPSTPAPINPPAALYSLRVYTQGFKYSYANAITTPVKIPARPSIARTLVIAICRIDPSPKGFGFNIKQFQVVFPLGSKSSRSPTNLIESYRGCGATMARNLRWNPRVEITDSALVVTLEPRSQRTDMPTSASSAANKDAAFLLKDILPNDEEGAGDVIVMLREVYDYVVLESTVVLQMEDAAKVEWVYN